MEQNKNIPVNGAGNVDLTALFRIGYGLYVITARAGGRDNGMIGNAVMQVTNTPNRIAVCINKAAYTHDLVKESGVMNLNCLTQNAPFSVFQHFGFQSGREVDKFADLTPLRAQNGVAVLSEHSNAYISLAVEQYIDLDTHGMFICTVSEARVLSDAPSVTYDYYQKNIKPRPQKPPVKGYVCRVCGWVYEGESLPEDIECPICHHGAADFEPMR